MAANSKLSWSVYSATILLGSFLLFLIQPLVGKIVTPLFGGISSIWSLCILFFQVTLLGGYTLTFFISKLRPKVQGILYILLMVGAACVLHLPPRMAWIPQNPDAPIVSLLILLLTYLAVPAVLLSTVSGLMQNWYRLSQLGDPYHLYSISNIGSLGALLLYPAVIEPLLTVSNTLTVWTFAFWGLAAFTVLCAVLMLTRTQSANLEAHVEPERTESEQTPKWKAFAQWIALSTMGSILLMGFTSHITHNIAPLPLLWVIPLSLYLLTFILCFSEKPVYIRNIYVTLSQAFLVLFLYQAALSEFMNILLALALLFCLCMVCHGEIILRKPPPRFLPVFYLAIAIGGVLGGIFVNLIAPNIFDSYLELPLALVVMAGLTVYLSYRYPLSLFKSRRVFLFAQKVMVILVVVFIAGHFFFQSKSIAIKPVFEKRNFYGVTEVKYQKLTHFMGVYNGAILHGGQYTDSKAARKIPLSYYHAESAIAVADRLFRAYRGRVPLHIGAVGLGAGTVAAYGQKNDALTFYELDAKMRHIAQKHFSFLSDSPAKVEILMGDARKTLEKQTPQAYDMMIIDAFNGDSIPVHLLTKEALELYLQHLQPDGLILFHTTNRSLDLSTVVDKLGQVQKLYIANLDSVPTKRYYFKTRYVVLSKSPWFIEKLQSKDFQAQYPHVHFKFPDTAIQKPVWTDEYSNLLSVLYFQKPHH